MSPQDEKNMRRVAFFVLLSLFLHALFGSLFYRLQETLRAKAPPAPPPQEVVWVNPQDLVPQIPVVSGANLQLADIAKPKVEKVPERTRFASKYNSSVKQETVATRIPKNAKLESETSEDGKKGDQAQEPGPREKAPKKIAMREPEPTLPKEEKITPKDLPQEAPPEDGPEKKEVSLEDLSLKPADFKDLLPKEARPDKDAKGKKVAMKEPSDKGVPYESPLKGRPGAPGDFDSFAHDFFPDVKIGDKTYLNTAAFPDVQYFTQLKRIFRMRFNPSPPLRRHFAGNRVVAGQVNVSMAVTVTPDGRLKELFVVKSSGIPGYDEEALRTIRESAPFSAPPQKVMDKDGVLRMHWNFITYL